MLCITTSLMTVQDSQPGPGNCQPERSKLLHRFMLLTVTVLSKSYLVHCKQVFIPMAQNKSFQIQNLFVSQLHRPEVQLRRQTWNTAILSPALVAYISFSINRYDSPSSCKMWSLSAQFLLPFPHPTSPKQGLPFILRGISSHTSSFALRKLKKHLRQSPGRVRSGFLSLSERFGTVGEWDPDLHGLQRGLAAWRDSLASAGASSECDN